ncbi:uncharacterized protein LOC130765918 [Actinidia eriantha]|uniref:uncharacterized protein LOC130765918 n=1 Tax=Actinidia eriantha TaxID=165200 RepID=UPI0025834A54|nr:uncharacterized protein LOC130765918 [Actinidia eriantha]XP_057478506.1 uncharacterized protein LOC130765918 [Actinidia eriantha]
MFPDIYSLNHLQELKLFNTSFADSSSLRNLRLPKTLKKLTLARTFLNWDEMSTLGKLVPKLEVLKLLHDAWKGPVWDATDYFTQLKFMKCVSLDLVQWNASSNHFPRLQRLALVGSYWLEEISSEIGCVPKQQMLEWNASSNHFPRLQRLALVGFYWLEEISSEIGYVPTQQMLKVYFCKLSLATSAMEFKTEQESMGNMGNNSLQVVTTSVIGRMDGVELYLAVK